MESQAIGNVTSAAATATEPSRAPGTAKSDAERAATTARREAVRQEAPGEAVPQRDPRSLRYQVDGATHRVVATIVDEGSNTVVRQIPDAEILRIAKEIDRMRGFLVEDKA